MSNKLSWSTIRPAARRIVIRSAATALVAPVALTAVPAAAAGPDSSSGCHRTLPSTQQRACTVDGFVIDHLPAGLGTPSDFEYEWEDVVFHSRVWETTVGDATTVDLAVKTIRGDKLIDLESLRTFLTEYHEKDPDTWELTAKNIGGYGGYAADDQVFYFISPGVAAEVSIDRSRFSENDLLSTAAGFYPEPAA
jgi:hypothetical protein